MQKINGESRKKEKHYLKLRKTLGKKIEEEKTYIICSNCHKSKQNVTTGSFRETESAEKEQQISKSNARA